MLGRHFIYNAHALGAYKGETYTNCREAFENSYANGFRYFEMDIAITKDGKYVLTHKTEETAKLTCSEFLKQNDIGTPLLFDDMVSMVKEKNDVNVMFDFLPGYYDRNMPNDIHRFSEKIKTSDIEGKYVLELYSMHNLKGAIEAGVSDLQFGLDLHFDEDTEFYSIDDAICNLKDHKVKNISISKNYVIHRPGMIHRIKKNGFTIYSAGWNRTSELFLYPQTIYLDFVTTDFLVP